MTVRVQIPAMFGAKFIEWCKREDEGAIARLCFAPLETGTPPPWPELPPLPDDDEHARWLRGEPEQGRPATRCYEVPPPERGDADHGGLTCWHCRRPVRARELVDIGHGVLLHHACGSVVLPRSTQREV